MILIINCFAAETETYFLPVKKSTNKTLRKKLLAIKAAYFDHW